MYCYLYLTEAVGPTFVQQEVNRHDINAIVIPGGLTPLIQTLDVSINCPLEEDATVVGELDD